MEIATIDEKEYLTILHKYLKAIPIYADVEAIECYQNKELIKVTNNNNPIATCILPIDKDGVRREFRFFPYNMPIILEPKNNLKSKEIYKLIFNYMFAKYKYVFMPLHPDYKIVSAISSQGGFVEMRHTHILREKLNFEELSSKLKNHIRNAIKNVEIIIDTDYQDYDFGKAIKGSEVEIKKRTVLAKKLIDNNKGFVVKAKHNNQIIAGLVIVYDHEWAYLLHSYQEGSIRGVVPYMILMASNYAFNQKQINIFDFEGSVIDDIDDFFSSFNAEVITYPYIIYANNDEEFKELINRSINILGRIKNERNNN